MGVSKNEMSLHFEKCMSFVVEKMQAIMWPPIALHKLYKFFFVHGRLHPTFSSDLEN
jgi:hypothetical protein